MASIRVAVELKTFRIVRLNEGADEPFIWPFFIRLDGRSLESASNPEVGIYATSGRHGNLGLRFDGMESPNGLSLSIPSDVGRVEMTLDTLALGVQPHLWRTACFVAVGVAFLEEDATSDSDALTAHQAAVKEVKRQADNNLREAMQNGGVELSFDVDEKAIFNAVFKAVVPGAAGNFAAGVFVPFADIFLTLFNIGSIVDPDDFVGFGITEPLNFGRILRNNLRGGNDFSIGSGENGEGQYAITGNARRVDTDEVPLLAAALTGKDEVTIFARNADDALCTLVSNGFGRGFEGRGRFQDQRLFAAGPAACTNESGRRRHVFGLARDEAFHHASTNDSGSSWDAWDEVPGKHFKSAPAVSRAEAGDRHWLHLVGRGRDDRYWHSFSTDGGKDWSKWEAIRESEFISTPAVVAIPGSERLVAIGLSRDQRLWKTVSRDRGKTWPSIWEKIPFVGNTPDPVALLLTSAPAAAFSDDGNLHVVCRAKDRTYWHTLGSDKGEFFGIWSPLGSRTFSSAPALVINEGGREMCVAGLGDDLGVWSTLLSGNRDVLKDWRNISNTPVSNLIHY